MFPRSTRFSELAVKEFYDDHLFKEDVKKELFPMPSLILLDSMAKETQDHEPCQLQNNTPKREPHRNKMRSSSRSLRRSNGARDCVRCSYNGSTCSKHFTSRPSDDVSKACHGLENLKLNAEERHPSNRTPMVMQELHEFLFKLDYEVLSEDIFSSEIV